MEYKGGYESTIDAQIRI